MTKARFKELMLNGLLFQNPILVLFLGMCSTLAVSTSLINALGMGLSTTMVLICSNVVISLLRKAIPKEIRIAAYVVVIASFVTIVDLCLKAFLPALSESLGLFIPLIVVNCIILGRAEAFASKQPPADSAVDGLAMGLGFTAGLSVMGFLRELIGGGAILGHAVLPVQVSLISAPCGGFLVLGCLVALTQFIRSKTEEKSTKRSPVKKAKAPAGESKDAPESAQPPAEEPQAATEETSVPAKENETTPESAEAPAEDVKAATESAETPTEESEVAAKEAEAAPAETEAPGENSENTPVETDTPAEKTEEDAPQENSEEVDGK